MRLVKFQETLIDFQDKEVSLSYRDIFINPESVCAIIEKSGDAFLNHSYIQVRDNNYLVKGSLRQIKDSLQNA